jgi:AcrR family transcriptional regulator
MAQTKEEQVRGRGRPREFDIPEALDKAMLVFWEKGYDATSLGELAEAMGITKPSLYAAFTDKKTLFELALARYADGPNSFAVRAYTLPTAREVVEALLEGAANVSSCTFGPRGCLFTQATLAQDPTVKKDAVNDNRKGEQLLAQRLRKAQIAGEISPDVDCKVLALYVKTVALGITVQGASGYSRSDLRTVVAEAMKAWPPPSS